MTRFITALAIVSVISACNQQTTQQPAEQFGGIGSYWSLDRFPDSTFTVSYAPTRTSAVQATATGDWAVQASGFVKLTINSSTGDWSAIPAGTMLYGIYVPNTVFILKIPLVQQLVYMPAIASCPSGTIQARGILVAPTALPYGDTTLTHGDVTINAGTGKITAYPRPFSDNSGTPSPIPLTADYTCSEGALNLTVNSSAADGIMTGSGIASLGGASGILAIPNDSTIVRTDLAGTYAGVAYANYTDNSFDRAEAFNLTIDSGASTGTASLLSSVEGAGTVAGSSYSIALGDMPTNSMAGTYKYSLINDLADSTKGLGFLIATNDLAGSGKKLLVGLGQDATSTAPYFMFAIEK